ncbi:hypothetical protein HMI56_003352, partial [Coelomomyces lativittatus]
MDHLTNLTTTSQPFFTFQTNKKIQSMDTSTPNTSSFQFLTNTPSLLTTSLKKKQMDSSFSFFKHMPTFKNHQDHEHSEKTMKHKKEEEEEEEEEDEDEEEEEEEVMIENADENNLSLTTATDLGSKTKEESMTMDLSSSSSSSSSSRSGMEEKERKEKKDEKKLHLKSKKTSNVSMSIPPASSSIQEDLSSSTFVKPLETPPPLFTFKTPPFPLPLSLPLPLPSSSSSSLSCKKKRRSLTHGSLVEEEPLEEEEKKMGLGVDQSKEETDIPRKAKKRKKEREEVTNLHEKNVSFSLPPTVVVHETNLVHKENDDDDDEEEEETSQVKRKEPFLSSKLKKTKKTMHLPWVLNTMPCSLDTWNQWIQQLIHQVEENELENEGLKTQLMDLEYQLKHQSKFIQDLKKQYQTWMATQQQHSQTTFHQQLDTWRKEVQQQEETLLQRVQDMLTTWQTSWQTWVAEHVDPPPPLPSPTACSLPPSLQAQLDQWPSQFNALETNLKTHCAQLHETLQSEFQTHFLPKLKETLLALPPFWETERWDTWVTTTIQKAWSEDAMNPLFSPPYSTLATFLMQTWPSEVTASFHSLTTSLSQHHQTLVTFEPLLQTLLRVCQTDLVNTHLTPIREHLDHPASWLSTGLTQVLPSLLLQHHQTHVLPFHHHTTAVLESLQKSLHDPPHLLQQALRDSVEPLLLSHTQRWEKSSFADLPTRLDQLVQLVQLGLKDLNDLIQAHHVSNDIDHPLKQELETTKQQLLESNQLNERLRKE